MNADQAIQQALQYHQAGRLAEAEKIYRDVLAEYPRHADALHLLGVLAGQAGQRDAAIALIQRAIELNPNHSNAHKNLGRLLGDAGRAAEAIAAYRLVTQLAPNDADGWYALGILLRMQGEYTDALSAFDRAITLQARFDQAHTERGNILRVLGQLEAAIVAHSNAVALNPNSAEAHHSLANSLFDAERVDEAINHYVHAIKLKSEQPAFHLDLANALSRQKRFPEAMEAYEWAAKLDPKNSHTYTCIGSALSEMRRYDESVAAHRTAIELSPNDAGVHEGLGQTLLDMLDMPGATIAFDRAVELNDRSASAWLGLGAVKRAFGQFEEADRCFRRSLEIDPNNSLAHKNLSSIAQSGAESSISQMKSLLDGKSLSNDDRVAMGFGLGKLLDDSNRFDEAFASYEVANTLFRSLRAVEGDRFDADNLRAEVDQITTTFTPEFFAGRSNWGNESDVPVFIVGMPRSGTTLVEQIAASHSKVFGAGELSDIHNINGTLLGEQADNAPLHWARDLISKQAEKHLDRLRALDVGAERIVDKMPGNIVFLGLIATMFPKARVIFCERDPRDNCLSCYFQWFVKNHILFSYDLLDCAKQYLQQERLRYHWLKVLPLRMLTVQYEELVADLEGQSRRLIDFLGLPWEAKCLEFHKTERTVVTASVWQVRQPIYNSSVGRWRHYEKHLGPLLKALNLDGVDDLPVK